MKIKTTDLTDKALDWAVAEAAYKTWHNTDGEFGAATGWLVRQGGHPCIITGEPVWVWIRLDEFSPTTNWGQLGPLVLRHHMMVDIYKDGMTEAKAYNERWNHYTVIAAPTETAICQAIVGVRLGDQVDVPEVLL